LGFLELSAFALCGSILLFFVQVNNGKTGIFISFLSLFLLIPFFSFVHRRKKAEE